MSYSFRVQVFYLLLPWLNLSFYYYYYCLFIYLFCFFRPALQRMEVPRPGGRIGATHARLHHSHSNMGYATAHSNARSLTHWARPGIKPAISWLLVRFVSTAAQWELLILLFWSSAKWHCFLNFSVWDFAISIQKCNRFCVLKLYWIHLLV